ncbi:MAG: flagellar hook-associated protein FlgK [Lachnospiraceae bacterium]|jgi:flagellar hook-associated protein 1 FlgK|nr:flagellar hook-associated protein FlgK [Lachnospiraceae bacterium]
MPSTFFGLVIADSGLRTYQTAVNTSGNNISNEQTKGYSRQEATMVASEAMRIYAKYGSAGTGVEVTQIMQQRDIYYDMKYWINQAKLGEQDTRAEYLRQMETYLKDEETVVNGERKTVGFTSIFGDMFNALDTLKTDASSSTTRNAYISRAKSLAEYFNSVSIQLSELQAEINGVIATKVEQINSIGQKIASLTKQINIIEQQGGYANELRDERNLLVDELSTLVPVEVKESPVKNTNYPEMYTGATNYIVKINGQKLVDTYDYEKLLCVPRKIESSINIMDEVGLYDIYWAQNASSDEPSSMKLELNSNTMTGELKALYQLRDGNNSKGFSGTITKIPASENEWPKKITISSPSITDPRKISMPPYGCITLDNVDYLYSSYTMKEENGQVTFEFALKEEADGSPVQAAKLNKMLNKTAEIGASVDFMGIPYYQDQLNEFVRSFAQAYNDISTQGVGKDGKPASEFFVAKDLVNGGEYSYSNYTTTTAGAATIYADNYYYTYLTAKNFSVSQKAIDNPDSIAVHRKEPWVNGIDSYDVVDQLLDLKHKTGMFRGGKAADFLSCLLSDISVDTQKAEIFTKNYENLNQAIQTQRMSVSSVDKDEEALNLVKFQKSYNLSSKLVQVLQEMYDRLILETGV